jgi:hypothetical protein
MQSFYSLKMINYPAAFTLLHKIIIKYKINPNYIHFICVLVQVQAIIPNTQYPITMPHNTTP